MKKFVRTAVLFVITMAVLPFLIEGPVEKVLAAGGAAKENAYGFSVMLTAVLFFLIANRSRLKARRLRMREARKARRERARLRNSFVLNLSPYEYEEYIAEQLRQEGFTDVDTTPKSGDFGADVLARDGDRTVCVQCKHYAPGHPVGVKAVQEIYSAKDYYGCDDAYLYTTSDYTKAAVDMANELGVKLIRTQI